MPYIRIETDKERERINIYENRSNIIGNGNAVPIYCNGKIYYIQTVLASDSSEINLYNNKRCGVTKLCIYYNGQKRYVCRAATAKNYTTLYTITSNTSITISKDKFFNYGGIILLYGGKGSNAAGSGGNGQICRVHIPAGIKTDVSLNISFSTTATSGGKGGNASINDYYCDETKHYDKYGNYSYSTYKCKNSPRSGFGGNGGAGGANCIVSYNFGGKSGTITAYGGGGGGGQRAAVSGYTDCDLDRHIFTGGYLSCNLVNYSTNYGSYGSGGKSGNGNTPNGANGANAVTNSLYDANTSVSARLIIGAYND